MSEQVKRELVDMNSVFGPNTKLVAAYLHLVKAHQNAINERRFIAASDAQDAARKLWDIADDCERKLIIQQTRR